MDRSSVKFFPPHLGGGGEGRGRRGKEGGMEGFFCQLNQGCLKLHEMDRSSLKKFHCLAAEGGFSASSPKGCSMMHEVWLGKVTSHHTI